MGSINKDIKVVFIQPSEPFGANAIIPQSLMELAAILQEAAISVEILDARLDNLSVSKTIEVLKKKPFDVVGITGLNCSYRFIKSFCFAFKREFPDKLLMAGGHFIMHHPEMLLRRLPIDVACTREGDGIIVDLVRRIVHQEPFDSLSNIAYLKNGEFVKTEYRLVEDLDKLPLPAYDLLDMDRYIKALNGGPFLITTGRGCVNHCYYCSNPYQKVRKISARNIVSHFDMLNQKYGIRHFGFSEENSFYPPSWLSDICDMLNELGREYDLAVGGCADHVTDELGRKLASIKGKVSTMIAVEHWNPEIQRGFFRGHISNHIEKAWEIFNKYNIPIAGFNILWGHPIDTIQSFRGAFKKSLEMQRKYNIGVLSLAALMPLPNSRFLREAQERKKILDYEDFMYAAAGYGPYINITATDDDNYRKFIVELSIRNEINELVLKIRCLIKEFFFSFKLRCVINMCRALEYVLRNVLRLLVIKVLVPMPKAVRHVFRKQLEHVFRVAMYDPRINYYHKIGCFEEIIRLPKGSKLVVSYPRNRDELYKVLDSVREAGVDLIGFISDYQARENFFNYPLIDVHDLSRINPDYCAIFPKSYDSKFRANIARLFSCKKVINLEDRKNLETKTHDLCASIRRHGQS